MADAEEDPTQIELSAADGTGAKLEMVKVLTGEEGSQVLFKAKAKCYRFDEGDNEWKERGTGEIRILKNKDSGKVRILHRWDGVPKLGVQMNLADCGPLAPHSGGDKAWVWTGMDYSEDEDATRETIAARFQNPEIALKFKEYFEGKTEPDPESQ